MGCVENGKIYEQEFVTATGSTGVSPNCMSNESVFSEEQNWDSATENFCMSTESVLFSWEDHTNFNMVDILKMNTSQLKSARLARQIARNLGYKSTDSIRHLIKRKFLIGCPVQSQ
jgi:hypothetical protein